ncbi:MFS general substrate transporter [Aureobasidium sp. EXF-10727]|nr:MFS general substrate transporter [Aureobasidium sp. EXF-10727]
MARDKTQYTLSMDAHPKDMDTTHDAPYVEIPLAPPSSPSLSPRQSSLPKFPLIWRVSSLESILEYKEALKQEKEAGLSVTISEVGSSYAASIKDHRGFRSLAAECAFVFSMALSQLIAEYMISGFAVVLPTLLSQFTNGETSDFWPATVLSLLLGSTLCFTARLSDKYGGYPVFMIAILWLCIWSVVAGFSESLMVINICRAMQGLAIAAYTPSSFALFGAIYPNGPRKTFIMGIYAACSPLGFFIGIMAAAVLPAEQWNWWFWIAAIMAFVALVAAYLSVPSDRPERQELNLTMDWRGAASITSGLILVAYALAASSASPKTWLTAGVLVPFIIGLACLAVALYIEGWVATCPLLPKDFFARKSVKPLLIACVFFYGSFGSWLFTATSHLNLAYGVTGVRLAVWFLPMAVGGVICGIVTSMVIHRIPPIYTMLVSSAAWVAAPLLLALGDTSMGYWPFVFPAMICCTVGIDITYNFTNIVLCSLAPLKQQALAGAVNSTTVNLGIAFSLAITQIVQSLTEGQDPSLDDRLRGHRNCFLFSAASAAVGFAITAACVRVSRDCVRGKKDEDEKSGTV